MDARIDWTDAVAVVDARGYIFCADQCAGFGRTPKVAVYRGATHSDEKCDGCWKVVDPNLREAAAA